MNLRILSILFISLFLVSCSSTSSKKRIVASENGTTEFYVEGSDASVIFLRAIVDDQKIDCNGPFLNITDQQETKTKDIIISHTLTIEQTITERVCPRGKSRKGSITSRYTPFAVTKNKGVIIKVPDYISRIEVSLTPITDK